MGDTPKPSDVLLNLSLNDIEVDDEGRVTINNAEVAERVKAAIAAAPAALRLADQGCGNTVADCGCQFENTKKNCGCQLS